MLIYLNGLILGLSLIIALGPQNIFLIKQGARKNHPWLSAFICLSCDIILMCASVAGLHQVLLTHPALQIWLLILGALFLFYYAGKSLKSAFLPHNSIKTESYSYNKKQIILFALGFSLLNPHAIIDSLVIIGGGSSQFPDHQLAFLLGVISASCLWFCSLMLTTRFFANVLTKNTVWQSIEIGSGLLMVFIGIKLALSGLTIN